MNLETLENSLVMSALRKAKFNSSDIPTGEYEIDATVHVRGTVKKGEDFEKNEPVKLDAWAIAAYLFDQLDHDTRKVVFDDITSGKAEQVMKNGGKTMKTLIEGFRPKTKKLCNGMITWTGNIDVE